MAIKLISLPVSSGKTSWVIDQARTAGLDARGGIRVVLPSRLQVLDFETRLASAGGALGIRVGTIADLAGEILEAGGKYPLLLPETVQVKVLGAVLAGLDLDYYQAISSKPGFIRSCLEVVRELKLGGIRPSEFSRAAAESGPRLSELGSIYAAYLRLQQEQGWADPAGMAWLAAEVLAADPDHCAAWGKVYFDGFDDLTPVQFQLIASLADRVQELVLTLTGSAGGEPRDLVHKRFNRTRELLSELEHEQLGVSAWSGSDPANPARFFEERLFLDSRPVDPAPNLDLRLEAVPDREAEVRAAARWLKKKLLDGEVQPGQAAILARSLEPYRGLISRAAGEYGLPIRLPGGVPLAENPLIAALLKLGQICAQGKEGLAWSDVLSLWRSPYLDWKDLDTSPGTDQRIAHLEDTRQLEEVVRWGRIIQGLAQWDEIFRFLSTQPEPETDPDDEDTAGPPRGKQAADLGEKFLRFVDLLVPPEPEVSRQDHISWFESLLGGLDLDGEDRLGLGVVEQVQAGSPELAERDWSALTKLNRILKEMIWAERLLESPPIPFSQFVGELDEIVSRTSYQPGGMGTEYIICADCTEVRGLNFQAVALLGLAEGEFPAAIQEDPTLRDRERQVLREEFGLPLRLSVDSTEAEYFYETVTRAQKSLLLTRPRIAENGAPWKASPYWEEVLRISGTEPEIRTSRSEVPLELAANQAELLEIIAARGGIQPNTAARIAPELGRRAAGLRRTQQILRQRSPWGRPPRPVFDGWLEERSTRIAERYPADHVWSASRLETYQTCPFYFFIGRYLELERLDPPEEGVDARQLGNIYHQILEELYQQAPEDYQIQDLLAVLPDAAEPVLRDAPRVQGFRATAWWEHTQREILDKIKIALIRLEELDPQYRFLAAEQRFGIRPEESPPLVVKSRGGGVYLLKGFIDRVDLNPGGELRIIDYKTSGKTGYDSRAVREGTKLQLPLYALAAQQGLKLGQVREGFYFHLLAGEPSSLKLSTYQEGGSKGPEPALERAAENGWEAVSAIKKGLFTPQAPDGGCPSYCPAEGFCWAYKPARW